MIEMYLRLKMKYLTLHLVSLYCFYGKVVMLSYRRTLGDHKSGSILCKTSK